MPGGERGRDQVRSRVGDRRRSSIRDQRHVSGLQCLEEEMAPSALIVLVITDGLRVDREVC
jgi:hypothetical protein